MFSGCCALNRMFTKLKGDHQAILIHYGASGRDFVGRSVCCLVFSLIWNDFNVHSWELYRSQEC